jgi:hypothetical protein
MDGASGVIVVTTLDAAVELDDVSVSVTVFRQ